MSPKTVFVTSLGSLFQCLPTLMVKRHSFYLVRISLLVSVPCYTTPVHLKEGLGSIFSTSFHPEEEKSSTTLLALCSYDWGHCSTAPPGMPHSSPLAGEPLLVWYHPQHRRQFFDKKRNFSLIGHTVSSWLPVNTDVWYVSVSSTTLLFSLFTKGIVLIIHNFYEAGLKYVLHLLKNNLKNPSMQ